MSLPLLLAMSLFWQPVKDINQYVGVDLTKLTEKEQSILNYKLKSLFPKSFRNSGFFAETPYWIKPVDNSKTHWILLSLYPGYNIPDESYIVIYHFDSHFKPLFDEAVLTGYRIFVYDVLYYWDSHIQETAIKITGHFQGMWSSEEDMKKDQRMIPNRQVIQYYRPTENGTLLVHYENGEGKYQSIYYGGHVPSFGSLAPPNASEIRSKLYSSDTASQLSSLLWLSGKHIPSAFKRETNVSREPVESSRIFERFQSDLQIRARIMELQESTNEWVKYRADQALMNLSKPMEMPDRYDG